MTAGVCPACGKKFESNEIVNEDGKIFALLVIALKAFIRGEELILEMSWSLKKLFLGQKFSISSKTIAPAKMF